MNTHGKGTLFYEKFLSGLFSTFMYLKHPMEKWQELLKDFIPSFDDSSPNRMHAGILDRMTLNNFLKEARELINATPSDFLSRKRAFYVMVECAENISRHGLTDEKGETEGFLLLLSSNNAFKVIAANAIASDTRQALEARLDALNQQDLETIKNEYRKQMMSGELTEKGGAGIGLFEIYMKSGNTLNYDFQEMGDRTVFALTARIDIEQQ